MPTTLVRPCTEGRAPTRELTGMILSAHSTMSHHCEPSPYATGSSMGASVAPGAGALEGAAECGRGEQPILDGIPAAGFRVSGAHEGHTGDRCRRSARLANRFREKYG